MIVTGMCIAYGAVMTWLGLRLLHRDGEPSRAEIRLTQRRMTWVSAIWLPVVLVVVVVRAVLDAGPVALIFAPFAVCGVWIGWMLLRLDVLLDRQRQTDPAEPVADQR